MRYNYDHYQRQNDKLKAYRQENAVTGVYLMEWKDKGYIGASTDIYSRQAQHWQALQRGIHKNPSMQRQYDKTKELPILQILERVKGETRDETASKLAQRETYWLLETANKRGREYLLNHTLMSDPTSFKNPQERGRGL